MARNKKWEEVSDVLRKRIFNGEYKSGQDFPSTLELMNEFQVYAGTIQNAVNNLIREGLLITHGSGTRRRIVRPLLQRSVRRGGFSKEYGARGRVEVLDLQIIKSAKQLPDIVKQELEAPALLYRTIQWRDDLPVALSTCYIPGTLPINQLKELLANSTVSLYAAMEELGLHPTTCEESLIATLPEQAELEALHLPSQGSLPVIRITRKVFDPDENLLELCFLSDRADCYEFVYKFPLI